MKWSDLEMMLLPVWLEMHLRKGCIARGFPQLLSPLGPDGWKPLRELGDAVIEAWQTTGQLPPAPSPSNRFAELRLAAAVGICREFDRLGMGIPEGWSEESDLDWLLWQGADMGMEPATLALLEDALSLHSNGFRISEDGLPPESGPAWG